MSTDLSRIDYRSIVTSALREGLGELARLAAAAAPTILLSLVAVASLTVAAAVRFRPAATLALVVGLLALGVVLVRVAAHLLAVARRWRDRVAEAYRIYRREPGR